MNKSITGRISILPMYIQKIAIIFPTGVTWEKSEATTPSPGPTLAMQVATADIADKRSKF